jgi:large repetitive protein
LRFHAQIAIAASLLTLASCGRTGLFGALTSPSGPVGPDLAATAVWPMFQHDSRHTGRSPFRGPQKPHLEWIFETGIKTGVNIVGGLGDSPVIGQQGTIYFGTTETLGNGLVHAVGPDGKSRWSMTTGRNFWSPIVAADGTLYVSSFDGASLLALDASGMTRWTFAKDGYLFGPLGLGDDGTLYVVGYGNSGDTIFVLFALSPDGRELWRFAFPFFDTATGTEIAVDNQGTAYVGADDGNLYAIDRDGTKRWAFQTGDRLLGAPVIAEDGTVYVGSLDSNLYAIGPDGTQKWVFSTDHEIAGSPALGSDGTLYLASADGFLYALNPDGTQRWAFADSDLAPGYQSPAVGGDGTIYFGDYKGKLFAVKPDGAQAWVLDLGGNEYFTAPVIAATGALYFFCSAFANTPGSCQLCAIRP